MQLIGQMMTCMIATRRRRHFKPLLFKERRSPWDMVGGCHQYNRARISQHLLGPEGVFVGGPRLVVYQDRVRRHPEPDGPFLHGRGFSWAVAEHAGVTARHHEPSGSL